MSTADLTEYRNSTIEQQRVGSLMGLLDGMHDGMHASVLDIGARDGYLSLRLADKFAAVTALDLEQPTISHPRISCVKGNILGLDFPDDTFDAVLCAEVLEHIDPARLQAACTELARVARRAVIIGVPFDQDTRLGRLTCRSCGAINPPWGHVNQFTEQRLKGLFPTLRAKRVEFVGQTTERTNPVSTLLADLAGNPYGTYEQEEPCVSCGAKLTPPLHRTLPQRLLVRASVVLNDLQRPFNSARPNWIHILFTKESAPTR